MQTYNRPKVGLGTIIMDSKRKKVLMGQRINSLDSGNWGLPGGHMELFEDFLSCAVREIKEETNFQNGLNYLPIDFQPCAITNDQFIFENQHYITLFLRCEYLKGKPINMEPKKCCGWNWFEWENLPQPLSLPIQNLLKQNYNPFY